MDNIPLPQMDGGRRLPHSGSLPQIVVPQEDYPEVDYPEEDYDQGVDVTYNGSSSSGSSQENNYAGMLAGRNNVPTRVSMPNVLARSPRGSMSGSRRGSPVGLVHDRPYGAPGHFQDHSHFPSMPNVRAPMGNPRDMLRVPGSGDGSPRSRNGTDSPRSNRSGTGSPRLPRSRRSSIAGHGSGANSRRGSVFEDLQDRNVKRDCIDDLTDLEILDQESILHELEKRFSKNTYYTYIGDVTIAINPFEKQTIYGQEDHKKYSKVELRSDLPPHIFCVGAQAYQRMRENNTSQSILINGESGAGKKKKVPTATLR